MPSALAKPQRAGDKSVERVPLNQIKPNALNPRQDFDEAELRSLAASLEEHGLIEPVVVRRVARAKRLYELIAGERRLRAAAIAGWTHIAVIVKDVSDSEALAMMLVENLQRRDLDPIEKARGLEQLCRPVEQGGAGKTSGEAAAMFGREHHWCRMLIRLLELPPVWQQRLISGEIAESKVFALLPHVKHSRILAQIETDMVANPWAWRTNEDFRRQVALIAEGGAARRGIARRTSAAVGSAADDERTGSDERPAVIAIGRGGDQTANEMTDAGGEESIVSRVETIIAAIEDLASLEELDRVADVIAQRREVVAAVAIADQADPPIADGEGSRVGKAFVTKACG